MSYTERDNREKQPRRKKEIIKELTILTEKDTTDYNLTNSSEQWLDKLRFKKINLTKCEENRRMKQDNIMF